MPRRANCAMTWDDNRHRICAVGGADGADGARASDTPRDLGVGARLTGRDRAQLFPDRKLKRSSADIHRRRRHLRAARDVVRERIGPPADALVLATIRVCDPNRRTRIVARAARRPASNLLRPSRRSRLPRRVPATSRRPSAESAIAYAIAAPSPPGPYDAFCELLLFVRIRHPRNIQPRRSVNVI